MSGEGEGSESEELSVPNFLGSVCLSMDWCPRSAVGVAGVEPSWSLFSGMQFGVASGSRLSDGVKGFGAGSGGDKDGGLKLDPEQQQKYDEIITLLLAGGYFRARISTLDAFDKVRNAKCYLHHPLF